MVGGKNRSVCCIYCGRRDGPQSREHVLQGAFGASATLPVEVCKTCNGEFSAIDKYFVDAVLRWHVGRVTAGSLGLGNIVRSDSPTVAARLSQGGLGHLPPQFICSDSNEWSFHGPSEVLFHTMMEELNTPGRANLSIRRISGASMPRCRVIRSAPNAYLIEGTDDELIAQVVSAIESSGMVLVWNTEATPRAIDHEITFNLSIDFDVMCRAMAKIALNFLCFRLGHDAAMSSSLDGLRMYARHGTGDGFDYVTPALLAGQTRDSSPFATSEQHALMLLLDEHANLQAAIDVYGKPIGVVRLAPWTNDFDHIPPSTWLLTRFDSTTKTYQDLTLPGDFQNALVNPQALGLPSPRKPTQAAP